MLRKTNLISGTIALMTTLLMGGQAYALPLGGSTGNRGAYVLCKDGSMYGFYYEDSKDYTSDLSLASAIAKCKLNGGGAVGTMDAGGPVKPFPPQSGGQGGGGVKTFPPFGVGGGIKVKTFPILVVPESGTRVWKGQVLGEVLVTPVTVNFSNPRDYDNVATGNLKLNLILRNTLSGQTIRLDSRQLMEGFRPGQDKSKLTINVVVDNMSAPLSEAPGGIISLSAENAAEGVNIILGYAPVAATKLGDGFTIKQGMTEDVQMTDAAIVKKGGTVRGNVEVNNAQRTAGTPIGGVIVKGGRNPGGNLTIVATDSRIMARDEAIKLSRVSGITPGVSSKGSGSPKSAGF